MGNKGKIGIVVCDGGKLAGYFPTAAEPHLVPTELPFTPDDQLLVDELREEGIVVEPVIWGAPPAELKQRYDLLVMRSPWDYMDSPDLRAKFISWLEDVSRAGVPMENDPELMLWLIDKSYLKDFEAAGVSIVPTEMAGPGAPLDPVAYFSRVGTCVFKPAISAAGVGLVFIETAEQARERGAELSRAFAAARYLAQPFVSQIRTDGEWSLVFLRGEFSHALLKVPAAGQILCQAERGGAVLFREPPSEVVEFCSRAIEKMPAAFALRQPSRSLAFPPAFLRLDILVGDSGPMLSECEGVEPELFFRARSGSAAALTGWLGRRLESCGSAADP